MQEITRIGCLGESEFQIIPYDSALFIPNLVTPNGDRKNDQLEIKNLLFYPDNQLTIFDRWGKKVFEARPYRQDWPNQRLSKGLYFFSFSAGSQVLKGWLMVAE
jgi:gliding motility-associated-like protein